MYRNYNKSNNSSDIFNKSGQNVMTNNKNVDSILLENKKLRIEINKKNKEIEDAKKRLNILEKEIQRVKKMNNNNNLNNRNNNGNRGKSVGIKRVNYNNFNNMNNNINNNFGGGMFGDSDPFNDSFFKFPNFNDQGKTDDSIMAEQMRFGFI